MLHWVPDLVLHLAHCPMRDMTGIPCPTCGGTHAAVALARGEVVSAFAVNPLVTALALGLYVWGVWAVAATLWPRLRRELLLGPREKKAARILAASSMILAWAWIIKKYGSF